MKKIIVVVMAFIFTFTLVGCANKNEPVEGKANFVGISENNLETTYTYCDDYFVDDATFKNNNLADTSLVLALTGANAPQENKAAYMQAYFDNCKFKNMYVCDDFKVTPTENTIGYAIASKEINVKTGKYLLVSVVVRGFTYGEEWVSNFDLGKTGNHHGFDQASDKVISGINSYIEKYNTNNLKLKIWLTGYSRAGAVAGLTAAKLVDQNKAETSNIYGFTFEAPASRVMDKKYENIYNYVNGSDIVTKLIPEAFNLVRPGLDIDYTVGKDYDKMAEYVSGITKNVTLKKYSGEKKLSTLISDIVKAIFGTTADFRETYVDEYQSSIQYFIKYVFGLTSQQMNSVKDVLQGRLLQAVVAISSKDKAQLKKFIIDSLDKAQLTYDSNGMNNALDKLSELVVDRFLNNIDSNDLATMLVNINSVIQNHFCEVALAYMRTK